MADQSPDIKAIEAAKAKLYAQIEALKNQIAGLDLAISIIEQNERRFRKP